jgi:lipopolysaccharide transport system ATP-binding protein
VQVQVQPDILIVDEALAVGDWLFQKRCFQQIEKLVADGTTLLFVSHDQESVRTLTNRALLLSHGRAKAWGISSEVVLDYRRLLHQDEAAYFGTLVPGNAIASAAPGSVAAPQPQSESRSAQMEFGEGQARVQRVQVLDARGEVCTVFAPGDVVRIRVHCVSAMQSSRLNVGVRLRNKEGVKIYSWGTLNQDMAIRHLGKASQQFWNTEFSAGQEFFVDFVTDCPLGMNLYEVQASISYEETPDYLAQRILHWVDEAAFFQVVLKRDEHFFGGVCDMRMQAFWE